MRKRLSSIILLVAAILLPGLATAQAPSSVSYPGTWVFATGYNYSIPSQQANTYTFFPAGTCAFPSPLGGTFPVFKTSAPFAPVFIRDANTAVNEVVTPSAATFNSASCGITITPASQHQSFWLQSGSAGLQEAVFQQAAAAATPIGIIIDRNWYVAAGQVPGTSAAAIINAVVGGSSQVYIVDVTSNPWAFYTWTGSKFIPTSGNAGGPATPAVAATAGAGTGPTIAAFGSGGVTMVNLTTGTSTATGSIFTLTYANTPASFGYAPVCSITNVGANVPAGTLSVSAPFAASHVTLTASVATTALTASTAYQFKVVCQ